MCCEIEIQVGFAWFHSTSLYPVFSYLGPQVLLKKVFLETRQDTCLLPGMVYPAQNEKLVQKLKEKNITCFAMDAWRGAFFIW